MIYYKGRQIDEINAYNVEGQGGGECGNTFEVIGYTETPQYIQVGIDYGQQIYDNWDASITDCSNKYKGDKQIIYFPLVDTSNVTNMGSMFRECTSLTSLDLSSFNTSKVTSMGSMFRECKSLTSLDLSNFNTSGVTSMDEMFSNCSNLTSLDVSNFDTSNVNNMSYMFNYCSNLTSLDLSSFNTSKVNSMVNMFGYCYKLQRIDGFIDWTKIASYPATFVYSNSTNGYPLRYMTIKNLGKTGTTFNFNNNHLQNWGDESNTTTYPLSVGARQSLVDSLLTYSYDRAANGLSNCTIQLHSKVKARLTEDEITAIQNKGYTIS